MNSNKYDFKRKWKRSNIYVQNGKKIEEELTYEKFIQNIDNEYWFKYKDKTIDFAFHYKGNKKIYELNINGYDEDAVHQYFNSPEELLSECRIDNKTIKEIWEDLETL